MSVLTIRSGKRFAVRDTVVLEDASGERKSGLMIELSAEGCRISCLGEALPETEDAICITTSCGRQMAGRVRWAHHGKAGLRFDYPLHRAELTSLIESANPLHPGQSELYYGT